MTEYGKEIFTNGIIISLTIIILEFIAAKVVLRIIRGLLNNLAKKQGREKDMLYILINKALSVVIYTVMLVLMCQEIIPLKNIGNALLGASGFFAVVLALGAQKISENIVAGVAIGAYEPFKKGDLINIPEKNITGFIEDLNLRHVVIRTYENTRVIIPNKIIDDAIVENRHNDKDMANMNFYYVGVAYGSDTDKAIKIVLDYLKKDALVLKKDLLSGLVFELKDSSITLRFGFYTKDQGDGFTVKCALNDFVLKAYKEANIEIPYNYLNVINHTA